jgi:hypothetical protein
MSYILLVILVYVFRDKINEYIYTKIHLLNKCKNKKLILDKIKCNKTDKNIEELYNEYFGQN